MLIHSTVPPSVPLCSAPIKSPQNKNSQQLLVSCRLSTAIHRALTVRFPPDLLAQWDTVHVSVFVRKWILASRLVFVRVCLHWAAGCVSLRELRSVPAVNPVCMICARDFNASCVLAEMRSCSDQGGADCRSHRAAILTAANTHMLLLHLLRP